MSSGFKLYAIGTVASDLISGNAPIKVFLHEIMSNVDGAIGDDNNISENVKTSDNKVYAINMNSSGTVNAVWINNNSNRVTPPNVRSGEKVEIWKYEDSDKYYWKTMGSELDLRKLEHVKWVFVNTDASGETQINDSNSYSFTMSTLNKMAKLHTSDSNGELTTHDIELDTKEGKLSYKDGKGNFFELTSGDDGFTLSTNNSVNIITQNANVKASTVIIQSDKTSINP